MTMGVADLFQKYYIDRHDERLGLFLRMKEHFAIRSALYPGSFTHLTPAFVFPLTCFVDTDRRAARFFKDPAVLDIVKRSKTYAEEPSVRFHMADYAQGFDEDDGSFDLLISQYAGFVSHGCKRYLRLNGYLLANNSHGDASMASIDPDYALVAVIQRRGERFNLSDRDLGAYFVPKKEIEITKTYLERIRKGVGYQKSAFAYVFKRVV